MPTNPIGDDALVFRPAFQAALGGVSRSKQIRDENARKIPEPDAYIGVRPAWKISTVKATVSKLVEAGNAARVARDTPRNGGRKRKSEPSEVSA